MIETKDIILKVKDALAKNNKKKFSQSVDLSIGLKGVDLKNPNNAIDELVALPKGKGKQVKVCALIDKELQTVAKNLCYKVILVDEFPKWKDNVKGMKKLANECDMFIAQSTIMPKIAQTFGRILGPRNKMPSPKTGTIVLPSSKLDNLIDRLTKSVFLRAKKAPSINVIVGTEKMTPEDISANVFAVLDFLVRHLPEKEQSIKHVYIKTTMGESVKIM
ncbi:50S ribosomal protein L1 [Candidatus Tiddalikarchaeum anstoanum]|nr:50S ribosomal protein L1 [Candidatus Tiddalikarchaeum anstoanum]